ncbi:AAA family ATPase [Noviherbaspirillum sp. ST9]|uniref:AAA family ATPase n=1 Tax=Noviherbaspirillum sp. ST9 TaxID=3401606 RepID=UPI003B58949C
MRLHRLDLVKYGKFTDRCVEFPQSVRDFHLIVGPNEAGKSTLRSAVLDLLFGIPPRSAHAFLHPLNELRVGASIGNRTDSLEFQRAKAQKQTLRTPADAVLADNTLVPFLGTADRHFFDQMFGLDHTRLVEGGNSILNAENDVGQVLFQSAAGIASLGKIRDALLAEADKLWAPRKAADRAYYSAADLLEKAGATLKETTVRTKVWTEANARLQSVMDELGAVGESLRQLEIKRSRLERIRRVAPFLQTVREIEKQLAELGQVADLPADAAAILSTAERDLATARQLLELRNGEVDKAQEELAQIRVDDAVLDVATEITTLEESRVRYSTYARDIARRQDEVNILLADIRKACTQLGWEFDSEDALAARLPSMLVRRDLSRLSQSQSGLTQALRAAEQAEQAKAAEIQQLSQDLGEMEAGEAPPALRAALAGARALGDTETALQKQQSQLAKIKTAQSGAEQALGRWNRPIPDLIAMELPGPEAIQHVTQDRLTLVNDRKALEQRIQEQAGAVSTIKLKISQLTELHQPTAPEAVSEARQERDESWGAIKAGTISIQDGAEQFETHLRQADGLADKRLENVEAAAQLQSHQHQLEQAMHQQSLLDAQRIQLTEELVQFDKMWAEMATSIGLHGMKLENIGEWIAKRDKAIAIAAECKEAQESADALQRQVDEYRLSLAAALREAGLQIGEAEKLTALCMQAELHIRQVESASVRRETLEAQLKSAKAQAHSLQQAAADARTSVTGWKEEWSRALDVAGLAQESATGTVSGALELFASLDELLGKVRQIRVERIAAMQADLEKFNEEVQGLAQRFGTEFDGVSPERVTQALAKRLARAKEARTEANRLKESIRTAKEQAKKAQESIETANALLQPLLERAGVNSRPLLAEAISRADAYRRCLLDLAKAKAQLVDSGDGLSREHLEQEIDGADLSQVTAELATATAEHSEAVQRQAALSAEKEKAGSALGSIGGSDAAAIAEAQRQEAIAQMADAAERYVKVFTAAKLLRWSIDRYRQEKQGPMLGRASAIFAQLTQGNFNRLVVDFDAQPMTLHGQRADGKLVGIAGMSDGTRDQLFLALRLAALEMHLEKAPPLPFIADDLFINYDDGRSKAGFEALAALSEKTQVIYLTHHDHLVDSVREVFGRDVSVVHL